LMTAMRRMVGGTSLAAAEQRIEARQRPLVQERLAVAHADALAPRPGARLHALEDVGAEQEVLSAIPVVLRPELARIAAHEGELLIPDRTDVDDERRLEGYVAHVVVDALRPARGSCRARIRESRQPRQVPRGAGQFAASL